MIPVFQTKFHSETTVGNCLAASLASLLHLKLEQVPEFENMDKDKWFPEMLKFFDSHGYNWTQIYEEKELQDYFTLDEIDDLHYIAIGKSPRNINVRHAVIFKKGQLVHDPHPSQDSILTEEVYWVLLPKKENK